jgi:hypothetical protein
VPAAATTAAAAPLPSLESISGLVQQALKDYNEATQKLKEGDFAGYGELITGLKTILDQLASNLPGAAGQ